MRAQGGAIAVSTVSTSNLDELPPTMDLPPRAEGPTSDHGPTADQKTEKRAGGPSSEEVLQSPTPINHPDSLGPHLANVPSPPHLAPETPPRPNNPKSLADNHDGGGSHQHPPNTGGARCASQENLSTVSTTTAETSSGSFTTDHKTHAGLVQTRVGLVIGRKMEADNVNNLEAECSRQGSQEEECCGTSKAPVPASPPLEHHEGGQEEESEVPEEVLAPAWQPAPPPTLWRPSLVRSDWRARLGAKKEKVL